ncbi:MAG TPA: HEAT repeat domain-containing protein, partial [Verrucomicrobiae bacterium]
ERFPVQRKPNDQVVQWCRKLMQEDHFEHEDIIGELQRAADPYSIPFLREAVLLKPRLRYLEYDDYGSYYKKCFWALRAIGTPDAIAMIREFAASDDPIVREQAAYRLSQIDRGH